MSCMCFDVSYDAHATTVWIYLDAYRSMPRWELCCHTFGVIQAVSDHHPHKRCLVSYVHIKNHAIGTVWLQTLSVHASGAAAKRVGSAHY